MTNIKEKMTSKTIKTILFAGLMLTMLIPLTSAHDNIAIAEQSDIGKVSDGTYNEEIAFQRMVELIGMHEENTKMKIDLEEKLSKSKSPTETETIQTQISDVQKEIDAITTEYNQIQEEHLKLYYIEPSLYEKYVAIKDNVVSNIQERYWEGKSFEDAKKAFPLVSATINHKEKSIEISLSKDIENSPEKAQYLDLIDSLIPKDIPWLVSYDDYAMPVTCTSRTSDCTPLIGGIKMQVGNNLLDGFCTLGIQAIRGGLDGFITAGHCADGKPFATSVYQSPFSRDVGSLQIELYQQNSLCDCAFVADRPTAPAMDNAIYQSSTSTYTPVTATSAGGQAGQTVKKSGVATGNTIGTVTHTSVSITNTDGITLKNQVRSTMNVACGDSGSPVTNGLGSSFYGIVVSKDVINNDCNLVTNVAYHSAYDQIVLQLQANPVLG